MANLVACEDVSVLNPIIEGLRLRAKVNACGASSVARCVVLNLGRELARVARPVRRADVHVVAIGEQGLVAVVDDVVRVAVLRIKARQDWRRAAELRAAHDERSVAHHSVEFDRCGAWFSRSCETQLREHLKGPLRCRVVVVVALIFGVPVVVVESVFLVFDVVARRRERVEHDHAVDSDAR